MVEINRIIPEILSHRKLMIEGKTEKLVRKCRIVRKCGIDKIGQVVFSRDLDERALAPAVRSKG